MSVGRLVSNIGAATVGAIVGAVVVLAAEGATGNLAQGPPPQAPAPTTSAQIPTETVRLAPERTILLAWSPGGLPVGTERALERTRGVINATTVKAGLDWIKFSRANDGSVIDNPGSGRAIPFEVAVIDPAEYAAYVPPSERDAVLALRHDEALLSQTSSEIRGAGRGLSLRLQTGNLDVAAVVSDVATNGYEALLAGRVPDSWERVDRFVLVRVRQMEARSRVERRIRGMLRPEQVLRIRAQGETPFLRYGDAVLPQAQIKSVFGEFPARPNSDGSLEVQPRWKRTNITARRVPILGVVTCHRALFPQLIHALRDVRHAGLAFTIDPGDFGGCYTPRFIDSNPGGRLSHHSWGMAIDFNVAQNRPGTRPDLDRRFVRIMEDNGFTWGGRWLIPDGMHFEWVRFP